MLNQAIKNHAKEIAGPNHPAHVMRMAYRKATQNSPSYPSWNGGSVKGFHRNRIIAHKGTPGRALDQKKPGKELKVWELRGGKKKTGSERQNAGQNWGK